MLSLTLTRTVLFADQGILVDANPGCGLRAITLS